MPDAEEEGGKKKKKKKKWSALTDL